MGSGTSAGHSAGFSYETNQQLSRPGAADLFGVCLQSESRPIAADLFGVCLPNEPVDYSYILHSY